jgi:very-short-patch-repair endonuclease
VIVEYDGDQHRTSTLQYDRDITRFDRATDAGFRVIRVRARGLFGDRAATLDRIREALTRSPRFSRR